MFRLYLNLYDGWGFKHKNPQELLHITFIHNYRVIFLSSKAPVGFWKQSWSTYSIQREPEKEEKRGEKTRERERGRERCDQKQRRRS